MTIFKEVKTGFNKFVRKLSGKKSWMVDTDYKQGDIVDYFGIELVCIKDHHSSLNFEEDEHYWKLNKKMRFIQ